MGTSVRWVRYGPEATVGLREEIAAAKRGDPLTPVTVVVPSNHVGVSARRMLASGALGPVSSRGVGLAAVTFLTTYRLAELLGAPALAAQGRRPVSTPVLAAAIRGALTADAGMFAPIAPHPATESALVAAYQELRELRPEELDSLARTSRRAADVVRLHRHARAQLARQWYDEQDLMLAAAASVTTAVPTLGHVVVYLPQRVSPHAAALVRAVGDATTVSVVVARTGVPGADGEVLASADRLALGDPPPPVGTPLDGIVAEQRTRILTASDPDDEVRAAVRAVVDAARDGVPLGRIGVLHASPDPYARLVHEHLAAAGVDVNGPAVTPVAERVPGRCLLQLLALPSSGFARHDVFAWLSAAPVCIRGRRVPATAWERISRAAGVVSGRADWDQRLARFADERSRDADADDPEVPEWRVERARREADQARGLRTFVLGLVDDLRRADGAPAAWSKRARWASSLFEEVLGDTRARDQWPAGERRAYERVELALSRLGALDAVEGEVTLDVFVRTLQLELEADLGRVGRFGEGVLVAPISMGVGIALDLLIVVGLAEGTFPTRVRDDSLLPDAERTVTGGALVLRGARIHRQHQQLLAALAGSRRHLLCVPRGDLRRSSDRVPSRWALDVASELAGARWWAAELHDADDPWVTHVPSFAAGVRRLDTPATAQEHRLRTLLALGADHDPSVLPRIADPVVAAGAAAMEARRSASFTRFDGYLESLSVPSPIGSITSASRLETWAKCPHSYLMQNVLRVEEVTNPEEELTITALERGTLVHGILERFVCEVLEPGHGCPGPDDPWNAADHVRLVQIADEAMRDAEARGVTGRPIFWRRERARILADLRRTLELDDAHRKLHRTSPYKVELEFGFDRCDLGPATIRLPDGRDLSFRGKIDRVDVDDHGGLHIVDYKTGGIYDENKLSADEPDLRGRKLQLAVYGVAARQAASSPDVAITAEYWFVTTRSKFGRRGYAVDDAVVARVGQTLLTMVQGIEQGVFPSHPTEGSTAIFRECASCDPDFLGTSELRRAFERKRTDPVLAPFAALLEPLAGDGAADDGAEPVEVST